MKHGFTLIEMLVVIAILGILTAISVPLGANAIRTSRETTCRNNLKNLHAAVISHANNNDGRLPNAGSYELRDHRGIYHEQRGWISWVHSGSLTGYKSGEKTPQVNYMSDGWTVGDKFNANRAVFAITNGTLFEYTGGDIGLYVCPEAIKHDGFKLFGARKGFSTYVMNEFFFWEGYKTFLNNWSPRVFSRIGTKVEKITSDMDSSNNGFNGFAPEAANLLLFAEHDGHSPRANDYRIGHNCVLHVDSAAPDGGKSSTLGMHHGKTSNPIGMSIFLDGHVSTDHKNTSVGSIKNLAYWYCRGEMPKAK